MNMKGGIAVIVSFIMALFLVTGYAFAGSDATIKQADKIIRTAERKMHSGKSSEADALLNQAAPLSRKNLSKLKNGTKVRSMATTRR